MERGSDKHGRRLDEALAHEMGALEVDLEPVVEMTGGVPEGLTAQDLDDRAELAALLGKEIWPAETQQLRDRVTEQGGSDALKGLLAQLPDGRGFVNVAEVWEVLTGHKETHRF